MSTPLSLPPSIEAKLPKDPASTAALAHAHSILPTAIFNHSLRVYLHALHYGTHSALSLKEWPTWWADNTARAEALLFIASISHDVGTAAEHDGPQRFEVEGADAAKKICLEQGIDEADAHNVWTAIAIHTSAGVAERIDPLSRLVRLGVKADFTPPAQRNELVPGVDAASYAEVIEADLARLEVERVLADAVVAQGNPCLNVEIDNLVWPSSEKHPKATWPGILMRAHVENPAHDGWQDGRNPAF